MPKKVNFKTKPTAETKQQVEEWVANRKSEQSEQPEPKKMKRLTLDIPENLHRAIKMKSVEEGVPMADLLRDLLQQHFCN